MVVAIVGDTRQLWNRHPHVRPDALILEHLFITEKCVVQVLQVALIIVSETLLADEKDGEKCCGVDL